jgi:predicted glycosyltransferase
MVVSSLMAGIIGVGSNLLTAVTAAGEVPPGAKKVAIVTGVIMVAKDVQAYLSQAPINFPFQGSPTTTRSDGSPQP